MGEEVTAHYGDDYCKAHILCIPIVINLFGAVGRNNRHCLCQTCEDAGRGGYTPEEGIDPPSDSDSDVSHSSSQRAKDGESATPLNVNERRTRRGVYAVMPESKIKEREQSTIPKIELDAEDSLLSLTFPSPSTTSDGALLETPQLSRESSTMSSTFHIAVPSGHATAELHVVTSSRLSTILIAPFSQRRHRNRMRSLELRQDCEIVPLNLLRSIPGHPDWLRLKIGSVARAEVAFRERSPLSNVYFDRGPLTSGQGRTRPERARDHLSNQTQLGSPFPKVYPPA